MAGGCSVWPFSANPCNLNPFSGSFGHPITQSDRSVQLQNEAKRRMEEEKARKAREREYAQQQADKAHYDAAQSHIANDKSLSIIDRGILGLGSTMIHTTAPVQRAGGKVLETVGSNVPVGSEVADVANIASDVAQGKNASAHVAALGIDAGADLLTVGSLGTASGVATGAKATLKAVVNATAKRGAVETAEQTLKLGAKAEARAAADTAVKDTLENAVTRGAQKTEEAASKAETRAATQAKPATSSTRASSATVKEEASTVSKIRSAVSKRNAKAVGKGVVRTAFVAADVDQWTSIEESIRTCDPEIYGSESDLTLLSGFLAGLQGAKWKGLNPDCLNNPDPATTDVPQNSTDSKAVVVSAGPLERKHPVLNVGADDLYPVTHGDADNLQVVSKQEQPDWLPLTVAALLLAAAVSSLF